MASPAVTAYLNDQQQKASGKVAEDWREIEEFYSKKLWHQLTLKMLEFVKSPFLQQGDALIKLYQNFIADFEHRVNPLSLVEIIIYVVRQIRDPKEALEFLTKIKDKIKGSPEATILCLTTQGMIKLIEKDMPAVKEIVKETQTLLDGIDGVTTVHGRFYELSSNYHRLMGNHADYYRDALRYLGCMPINDMSDGEKAERAFNLGLAAILGKGVYNFGELLAHPILESLRSTNRAWLVELLYAFNSGDLVKFEKLKPHWIKQPDLDMVKKDLTQKITLLCLMEMTFKRPATNRQLTFAEIASEAQIPLTEVELLVMKALALGLVKGTIDEVDSKVHMTWVQPRVLDRQQVQTMLTKLELWRADVSSMEGLLESKAKDILT